jgi:signal transduction histidine kinase
MSTGDLLLQEIFFILAPAVLIFAAILGITYLHLSKFRRVFRRYRRLQIQEVENERKRIANDLHDFVAGKLVKIKTELQLSLNAGQDNVSNAVIERSLVELSAFHNDLRNVVEYIYPKELLTNNLKNSLNHLADEMTTQFTKVIVDVEYGQHIHQVQLHQLYRIIQEMLSNIIAHAMPTTVIVCLYEEPEINAGYLTFSYAQPQERKLMSDMKLARKPGRGKFVVNERLKVISAKLRTEVSEGNVREIVEFPIKMAI